jgi:hypothetical protein
MSGASRAQIHLARTYLFVILGAPSRWEKGALMNFVFDVITIGLVGFTTVVATWLFLRGPGEWGLRPLGFVLALLAGAGLMQVVRGPEVAAGTPPPPPASATVRTRTITPGTPTQPTVTPSASTPNPAGQGGQLPSQGSSAGSGQGRSQVQVPAPAVTGTSTPRASTHSGAANADVPAEQGAGGSDDE